MFQVSQNYEQSLKQLFLSLIFLSIGFIAAVDGQSTKENTSKINCFSMKMIYINSTNSTELSTFYNPKNACSDISQASFMMHYMDLLALYKDIQFWRDIFIFFGSFFTGLGVTLNTLCIIIFIKSKLFRNSSFPYYVYILAFVDTLNILFRFAIPQLIETYIRYILVNKYKINELDQESYDLYTSDMTSGYHCSIFLYFYNSLTLISVWLMCAVSFERWIVIKIPIQTRKMIKFRAILILLLIIMTIFALNVFDLAPGLYIKPQWYANLTLLCERDDVMSGFEGERIGVYKQLGPITFNTETFAFVRTLLQTIVPFLLVLYFNSLIIYNFKKIKANALRTAKSSPCLVYSSYMGMNKAHMPGLQRRHSSHNSDKFNEAISQAQQNKGKQLTPNRSMLNSSVRNSQNDLVVDLNRNNQITTYITKSMTPSDIECNDLSDQVYCGPVENDQIKNSFLMPPNLLNKSNTRTTLTCNSSINTSTDKLSVATSSNLTATTNLNQTRSNTNIDCDVSRINNNNKNTSRLLFAVKQAEIQMDEDTESENGRGKKTITTQTSRKLMSKRTKNNKHKLNRETDIMLIVLSFSILISQLPCAVAWYLIYYRNILQSTDSYDWTYMAARTPIILYILRLVEIVYFSLNFFFYITLSPTLRREINSYIRSYKLMGLFKRNNTSSSSLIKQSKKLDKNEKNVFEKKNLLQVPSVKFGINTGEKTCKYNYTSSQNHSYSYENENPVDPTTKSNDNNNEYFDFVHKLRSITPKSQENVDVQTVVTSPSSPPPQSVLPAVKIYIVDNVDGENMRIIDS